MYCGNEQIGKLQIHSELPPRRDAIYLISGLDITKPHACFMRCGAGGPGDDHATFGLSEYICGCPLGSFAGLKKLTVVVENNPIFQ